MNTIHEEQKASRSIQIQRHVTKKVLRLQNQLLENMSSAKATAANLRRAITRPAGSEPNVWDITLGGLPEALLGWTDEPSYEESAVHLSLTLFALHQQSQSKPMHVPAVGVGSAVRTLILQESNPDFESSPTIRRFNALVTADSMAEMTWHLRSLITQLRSAGIALDYGRLAADLYQFSFPEVRDGIRLRWGRDLYAPQPAVPATSQ